MLTFHQFRVYTALPKAPNQSQGLPMETAWPHCESSPQHVQIRNLQVIVAEITDNTFSPKPPMGIANKIQVKIDIIRDHVLNYCFKHLKQREQNTITVNKQIKYMGQ